MTAEGSYQNCAYVTDVRVAPMFEAYCSCGWISDPEETPEGADALADDHDDTHANDDSGDAS